jgi:uncharacterized membrane protein YfhO
VLTETRFQTFTGTSTPAADSSASIALTKYGLNQLLYTAQNNGEGLAVFADIYYPAGWKAYIDEKESPIIRVNYALRGLKIPAGKHNIRFTFEPATFFLGRKISAISSIVLLIGVAIGFIWSAWKSRPV